MSTVTVSVVTPAFDEVANLAAMHDELVAALAGLGESWEWVVVDDHSHDGTYEALAELAGRDPRVRGVRLARNAGAHAALLCGLQLARGRCAVLMAADLQDPPATIPALVERWRQGAQVVWAVRRRREGEKASTVASSRLYYWLMRHIVGLEDLPSSGADFCLVDRAVIDALGSFRETHVSVLALLTWMGFRQERILYDKQARRHGTSGWSLRKKLKLVVDSVTSFSYFPIRLMSYLGTVVALLGFLYAAIIVLNAALGSPPQGWSSLMVVVLVLGGAQMVMLGILGEYVWRGLDEARQRPRYLVERSTDEGAR